MVEYCSKFYFEACFYFILFQFFSYLYCDWWRKVLDYLFKIFLKNTSKPKR